MDTHTESIANPWGISKDEFRTFRKVLNIIYDNVTENGEKKLPTISTLGKRNTPVQKKPRIQVKFKGEDIRLSEDLEIYLVNQKTKF